VRTAATNASVTVGSTCGMLSVLDDARLRLLGGLVPNAATPLPTTPTIGSSTTPSSGLLPSQGFMTMRDSGSSVDVAGAAPARAGRHYRRPG
jgi:hypothetical protein